MGSGVANTLYTLYLFLFAHERNDLGIDNPWEKYFWNIL